LVFYRSVKMKIDITRKISEKYYKDIIVVYKVGYSEKNFDYTEA